MPNVSQHTITSLDSYPLAATLFEPDRVPIGLIQINGALGVSQTLYHHFAQYLAEHRYVVLTFDYRGIGASAPVKLKGFPAFFRDWGYQDMTAVFDWLIERYPLLRKIQLGHSAGAQLMGLMPNITKADYLLWVAASAGYIRDLMQGSFRFTAPFFFYIHVPFNLWKNGYFKASRLFPGEDIPHGVMKEWRKWVLHPDYLASDFGTTLARRHYDFVQAPIKQWQIMGDPYANKKASNKLLALYPNAEKTVERINPKTYGKGAIGHMGFFSRRFQDSLWPKIIETLDS